MAIHQATGFAGMASNVLHRSRAHVLAGVTMHAQPLARKQASRRTFLRLAGLNEKEGYLDDGDVPFLAFDAHSFAVALRIVK